MSRSYVIAILTLLVAVCTIGLRPVRAAGPSPSDNAPHERRGKRAPEAAGALRSPSALDTLTSYLTGDAIPSDSDGIPHAAMSETVPPARSLPNYDSERDDDPGIKINKGGDFDEEDASTKYQTWVYTGADVDLNGPVTLTMWSAMKDFHTDKEGAVTAFLMECDADGDNGSLIASATVTRGDWDTNDTGTWIEDTFDFGSVSYVIPSGRSLGLKIVVPVSAGDDMWFAYGTMTYASRLDAEGAGINYPPTLDLDADDSGGRIGSDFATLFGEDGPPVYLTDVDASIVDLDDTLMTSLTVSIENLRDEPFEILAADVSGTSIASDYDADGGVLTLSGLDSTIRYERVLRTVTYDNLSDDPATATRNIAFVVRDARRPSNTARTSLTIQLANDPPVIQMPGLQVTRKDVPVVFQASNGNTIAISDPDAGNEDLRVSIGTADGTFTLNGTFGLSFTLGTGAADTTAVFTGSQVAITNALSGSYFRPPPAFVGDAALTIAVDDLGHSGAGPPHAVVDSMAIVVTEASAFVECRSDGVFIPDLYPGDAPREVFNLEIVSHSALPETLTTLVVTNTSQGAGKQTELDNDWAPLFLYARDGGQVISAAGSATATFGGGVATFSDLSAVVSPWDTLRLRIDGGASLVARDGDMLDMGVLSPSDIYFEPPITMNAHWPLNPGDQFPVDGMVAAQIKLHPSTPAAIAAGSVRNLALDLTLPANGYEADRLNRLDIENVGSARPGLEISRIEAWVDADDDGAFDDAIDVNLGTFSFTGSRWELTGLDHTVPLAGLRVFVTVDIVQSATQSRTVRLSLPTSPDVAVGMMSGNDGPIDVAVASGIAQTITLADRVVLSSAPVGDVVVTPGANGVVLLDLVATNNYSSPKQVTRIMFHNSTQPAGASLPGDLDDELGTLVLRLDGNDNGTLDDTATDPIVEKGFFISGVATFNALFWDLPAGATRHLFVTADLSLMDAADGDLLAVELTGLFDLDFFDATNVSAAWPIGTEGTIVIDGMLATQITDFDITPLTVAPTDGPVLAFDAIIPSNGYRDDILESIEFVNLGTANPTDLDDMRLWRDGGDGVFSGGLGDDTEVGPLVWTGSTWKTPLLGEAVPQGGVRLFLGATIDAAPSDSVTIWLSIPVQGIEMASGNDGPTDRSLTVGQSLLISSNPLLASLFVVPAATTIGQTATVRMVVSNAGTETINSIAPSPLSLVGDATATLATGPVPANVTLTPGTVDTFTWTYATTGAGAVHWTGWSEGTGATSGLPRRALDVGSNNHLVFSTASEFDLFAIGSMPFTISRGQTDVVPMSLTIAAPGDSQSSDVRLQSLRLRVEDGSGTGIVPADVLDKVTLSEGSSVYVSKTALETSGAEIDLTLSTPLLVRRMEPITVALRLDVLATTVEPEFRVLIVDSTWILAEDAISGAPVVARLQEQSYPITSGLGRIGSPPDELRIQAVTAPSQRVGWGQTDVTALSLQLDNPGMTGITNDIAVGTIALGVTDSAGVPISNPSAVFSRVRVIGPLGTAAERVLEPADTAQFIMDLSPLIEIPVNTPYPISVRVDVAGDAPTGAYRLRLGDPFDIDARDAESHVPLPVSYETTPLEGPGIVIESTADSLMAASTPLFPANVGVGQTDTPAMLLTLRHPSAPGAAAIRVDAIVARCQNEIRQALIPGTLLDRVRLYEGGLLVADVTSIPPVTQTLAVPLPGIMLEPGDSLTLEMRVDILNGLPASFLEIFVEARDILATDANTGALVMVSPEPGQSATLTSGLTWLSPPPTELVIDMGSTMPAVLTGGSSDIEVARLSMTNTAPDGSGAIAVGHLTVRASNADLASIPIGATVRQIAVDIGASTVGSSDTLTTDSTTAYIPLSPPIVISAGETVTIVLRVDLGGAAGGSLRLGIDETDIGVLGTAVPQIRVEPEPGKVFPMWTEVGNFSPRNLDTSYSNFPNPFAAGRATTTFVYFLPSDGNVTLRIWTARGEDVTTIRSNNRRSAGLYQDDTWDGRNDKGTVVVNG